jgi:glycosyltransferase involved in cell wall biosynthesis
VSTPRAIVLVGNFLPDRQESMLRFEHALSDGFSARNLPVETWRPEPIFAKWMGPYRYGGFPKYLGYLDKFVLFPRTIRKRLRRAAPGTIYHIVDHSNAVYAPHFRQVPLVVTCHDLLQVRSALGEFPQNPLTRSGQSYQRWILDRLRGLRCAACVSEKTRADLLRLANLPDAAIRVIPNGLNYPYHPLPANEAALLVAEALHRQGLAWPGGSAVRPPFLFGIGGAQWYKNRTGLLKIFGELKNRLSPPRAFVYVGPAFDAEQENLIQKLDLGGSLLRIPQLSNDELRAAYSLADGLIFPSWEEGFGWPIAEAQACGCPVFASHRAPMTEVGGAGARYFDPADPASAAAEIAQGLALPEPLRAAGLRQAQRWDAQLMLDAYLELYSSLLPSSATFAPSA